MPLPTAQQPFHSFPSEDKLVEDIAHLLAKFKNPGKPHAQRESWWQHTRKTLGIWTQAQQHYQAQAGEDETLWQQLYVAMLFHDSGKFIDNFQLENRKKEKGEGPDWTQYLRHELYSVYLLYAHLGTVLDDDALRLLLAVAGHHKPLSDRLFREDTSGPRLRYQPDNLHKLTRFLASFLPAHELADGYAVPAAVQQLFEKATRKGSNCVSDHFHNTLMQGAADWNHLSLAEGHAHRCRFARLMGLLHLCDWRGSGHQDLPPPLQHTEMDLRRMLRQQLVAKGKMKPTDTFAWRPFQQNSDRDGNMLVMAPTGAGKTEAALRWALRRQPGTKVIYCLPTQVTSNAIFERLRAIYPDEQNGQTTIRRTALVHGKAKDYRSNQQKTKQEIHDPNQDPDAGNEADWQSFDYTLDRAFFRDYTVCTVDQLLTAGFNLRHWELKTLHLHQAKVIIDEIHLFQPYTLGLIVATIRYLREHCGTQFYIMTATMPRGLRDLLCRELGIEAPLIDKSQDAEARNTWQVRDVVFDTPEVRTEIKRALAAGKKVLVVRNTVNDCIATFQKLQEASPEVESCCLHSRMAGKHRREKEHKVVHELRPDEGFLLVATQVVEVSLDIDFDLLYTENAPLDALCQRAGRVNRARKKHKESFIYVFPHTPISAEFVYADDAADYLDQTWQLLQGESGQRITEQKLKKLIETLYAGRSPAETDSYKTGLGSYRKLLRKSPFPWVGEFPDAYEEAFTREGLDSRTVMPLTLWENDAHKLPPTEWSDYTLSLRSNQYRLFTTEAVTDAKGKVPFFPVIDDSALPYTRTLGLCLPSPKKSNTTKGQCV